MMTVHQELLGNKADHGTVDFELGRARQFLIFPKSILKFNGSRIVGIKYDPPKERAKSVKEAKKAGPKSTFPEKKSKPQAPPHEKIVHFTKPELQEEPDEESEAIEDVRRRCGMPWSSWNRVDRLQRSIS